MKPEFDNQVAVVTGGAQGIGFAICKLLRERGARVAVLDLDDQGGADAARRLDDTGENVRAYQADVTDESSLQAARAGVLSDFGHVEVLVNNAGIYPHASLREITIESWDKMFDVNAKGMFLATRTFMDAMIEQRYGRIVSIVTTDAYIAKPSLPHYAASKAAVANLVKTFALELAQHQVLCNGVSPGAVATARAKSQSWLAKRIPTIPLQRAAEPEDMAEYVCFLASSRNRFMTGETIIANGGTLMV